MSKERELGSLFTLACCCNHQRISDTTGAQFIRHEREHFEAESNLQYAIHKSDFLERAGSGNLKANLNAFSCLLLHLSSHTFLSNYFLTFHLCFQAFLKVEQTARKTCLFLDALQ